VVNLSTALVRLRHFVVVAFCAFVAPLGGACSTADWVVYPILSTLRTVYFDTMAAHAEAADAASAQQEVSGAPVVAQEICSDPSYSWQKLYTEFLKAKAPARRELPGRWVMTGFVMTDKFRTGGRGKDFVLVDCGGVRRGGRLEWTLKFTDGPNGLVRVDSDKIGDDPQSREIGFERGGSLILEQDDGGDSLYSYRCRMAGLKTLVCVLRGAQGHGMEFRKQEDERSQPAETRRTR